MSEVIRTADRDQIRSRWKKILRLTKKRSSATAWHRNNTDRRRQYMALWKKKNPGKTSAYSRRREHSKRLGRTEHTSREVAEFYNLVQTVERASCYICGKIIPKGKRTVDHIIPLAKGGLHAVCNLAIACRSCNCSKAHRLPEDVGLLPTMGQAGSEGIRDLPQYRHFKEYVFYHAIHAPNGTAKMTRLGLRRSRGVDASKMRLVCHGRLDHWRGWSINHVVYWTESVRWSDPLPKLIQWTREDLVAVTYRGSAFVPLTNGKYATIDTADWPMVRQRLWSAAPHNGSWRAKTNTATKGALLLNQFIAGSGTTPVRYLNGNSLDCRRSNLIRTWKKYPTRLPDRQIDTTPEFSGGPSPASSSLPSHGNKPIRNSSSFLPRSA